ncbi:hypothetical protein D3273_24340 [Lichenibacterium minor]|uniref:Secreted protein n=1 Tax=Lichenibacterium minor TaxID=2316528 RepID=A0A4V1RTZ5_9HYPH|nr:hypothetical protein [Lichenibacterium minor]RYC29374.1 hypothetical protein D3273_24340 [Lichenibacterium minor]
MHHRWAALLLLALVAIPSLAQADDDEIKLGTVMGYPNEAAASAACPDGVVWADRKSGFYYPRFAPEYGVTPNGVFTCYKQAKSADYWGLGTSDSLASRRGRVFPFTNDEICTWYQDKAGNWKCGSVGS